MSIRLSTEECFDVCFRSHDDFQILREEQVDHRRWSVTYEYIVKQISTNRLYSLYRDVPATESQDGQDQFSIEKDGMVELTEMEAFEKTITDYRVKK